MDAIIDALEGGTGTDVNDARAVWSFDVVCDFGSCVDRVWSGVSGRFDDKEMDKHRNEGNAGAVHHIWHCQELNVIDWQAGFGQTLALMAPLIWVWAYGNIWRRELQA